MRLISSSKVFTLDNRNEELYWSSKACNLNPSEMRSLNNFIHNYLMFQNIPLIPVINLFQLMIIY
jgi:hypothetical protein